MAGGGSYNPDKQFGGDSGMGSNQGFNTTGWDTGNNMWGGRRGGGWGGRWNKGGGWQGGGQGQNQQTYPGGGIKKVTTEYAPGGDQGGGNVASDQPPAQPTIAPPAQNGYQPRPQPTEFGGGNPANPQQPQIPQTIAPPAVSQSVTPTPSPYRTQLSQMDNNSFMRLIQQMLGGQTFNPYQTPQSGTNSLYNRFGR